MKQDTTDMAPSIYQDSTDNSTSDLASATSCLLRAGEVFEDLRSYRTHLLCEEPCNDLGTLVLTPEIVSQKNGISVQIHDDWDAASEQEVPLSQNQSRNITLPPHGYVQFGSPQVTALGRCHRSSHWQIAESRR